MTINKPISFTAQEWRSIADSAGIALRLMEEAIDADERDTIPINAGLSEAAKFYRPRERGAQLVQTPRRMAA